MDMKRTVIVLAGMILLLSGCGNKAAQRESPPEVALEPVVVYQSLGTTYLLSCLHDAKDIGRGAFDMSFETAEKESQSGKDMDKLRFICLSLNEKADQKQFKKGLQVLAQYIDDHPDTGEDLRGFQVLAERLDQEVSNRWGAWKSLLSDKKKLTAEVESLRLSLEETQAANEALQKQIEQLKNIDDIIKRREAEQK